MTSSCYRKTTAAVAAVYYGPETMPINQLKIKNTINL